MKLQDVFPREQVIRERAFSGSYAPGKNLDSTVAYCVDERGVKMLNESANVAVIITRPALADRVHQDKGVVASEHPQRDYYLLHNQMVSLQWIRPLNDSYIDSTAEIAPTAIIGANVHVGKNVRIGNYVIIEPNSFIGERCDIDSFAVIGASSMQRTHIEGQTVPLAFAGGVQIGARSQILTGAIIQRPYQGFYTEIGSDCVISTKVVVGHGSSVGDRTMMSGNSAIAGNGSVGSDVWIGGGAMISDGITIGNEAKVLAASVVIKDVASGQTVSGHFAMDHREHLRKQVIWKSR